MRCDQPGPFVYAVTISIYGQVQVYDGTMPASAETQSGDGTLNIAAGGLVTVGGDTHVAVEPGSSGAK